MRYSCLKLFATWKKGSLKPCRINTYFFTKLLNIYTARRPVKRQLPIIERPQNQSVSVVKKTSSACTPLPSVVWTLNGSVPTDSRLPLQTPFLSYGAPHFLGWRQHPFKESADPSQDADNQGLRDLATWHQRPDQQRSGDTLATRGTAPSHITKTNTRTRPSHEQAHIPPFPTEYSCNINTGCSSMKPTTLIKCISLCFSRREGGTARCSKFYKPSWGQKPLHFSLSWHCSPSQHGFA